MPSNSGSEKKVPHSNKKSQGKIRTAGAQQQELSQILLENLQLITWSVDRQLKIKRLMGTPLKKLGITPDKIIGTSLYDHFNTTETSLPITSHLEALKGKSVIFQYKYAERTFDVHLKPLGNRPRQATGVLGWAEDVTEQKRTENALQQHILALTRSMDDINPPRFQDLFELAEIQQIQDTFAEATGVASVITDIQGHPITRPSHFCRLCQEIIRENPRGLVNCMISDMELGKNNPESSTIQPCINAGLLNGGTRICVGEHHVANWLVGQVLDEAEDEEIMMAYAQKLGVDSDTYRKALREVPRMSRSQFEKVCNALFVIARQLSVTALQNVQQARFIAERRKVETDLANERSLLWTIIDNIPDSIYVKDLEGRKTIANPADLDLIGAFSDDEVLGKTDADVYPYEKANQFKGDDEWVIKNELPLINKEEYIPKLDGSTRWILTSKVPLRDQKGKTVGLVGIGRDITERKLADEEIRRLNAELEQRVQNRTAELEAALRELEAFSYSVSHDLRAPLRAINGYSQILLEDQVAQLDQDGKNHLNQIINSTKRMSQIVDDLLKLSKVTRFDMNREWINLGDIAASILNEYELRFPERHVHFETNSDMMIYGDTSLIRIMMENLISNAWKFTSKREESHIEVGKTVLEGTPVYFVRDDGAGFDMAYASKLFIAFQRLHSPAEFEGTGIGLATVQRIIARHGGRVWARSAIDQGTTIYFILP